MILSESGFWRSKYRNLLRRIGHAEQRLRRTRFTNNALKCQLAKRAIDYQTVREIQTRYAAGEKKIGQQKELILTLRAVGDSIAFIYADRWDLKQFVWHEDSGFITGKRGSSRTPSPATCLRDWCGRRA